MVLHLVRGVAVPDYDADLTDLVAFWLAGCVEWHARTQARRQNLERICGRKPLSFLPGGSKGFEGTGCLLAQAEKSNQFVRGRSGGGRRRSGGGRAACGKRGEIIVQFMVRRIMGYARAADAEEVEEDASGNPRAKRHMNRLLAEGVSLTRMPWKAVLRTQCVHYIHGLRLGGCTYTYLQESLGRVPEAVLLRSADRSEGCADLWCQACKDANTSWT